MKNRKVKGTSCTVAAYASVCSCGDCGCSCPTPCAVIPTQAVASVSASTKTTGYTNLTVKQKG